MKAETYHSLERTSPKGTPFTGVCTKCGKEGLTPARVFLEWCPNPKGITENESLINAVEGPKDA